MTIRRRSTLALSASFALAASATLVSSLGSLGSLAWAGAEPPASPDTEKQEEDASATEDVISMLDGRVLHGRILEEKPDAIVFEVIVSTIRTKQTLLREEIAEIQRGVAIEAAPAEPVRRPSGGSSSRSDKNDKDEEDEEERAPTFGAHRSTATDESLPSLYVVPMEGQMGTDVNIEVYEKIAEDIRAHNPTYLVFELKCLDNEDRLVNRQTRQEGGFNDSTFLDMYREITHLFRAELRGTEQVMWVRDSSGISSVFAMAWDQMFMDPDGRLGGLARAAMNFNVQDPEVRAKFRDAYMAWLEGFAMHGRYDPKIIEAMVIAESKLSASWEGREVHWNLDTSGEYIVDDNDEETLNLRAKQAEDFCISKGTAESLDDIALLLGVREYRVIEGDAARIFEGYKEDWRRSFGKCETWYRDYERFMSYANGEDAIKYLGQAKGRLEDIIAAADRYKAVEVRLVRDFGMPKLQLVALVDQLKERIRAAKQTERGGRGAPGSGGPGSGG